MFCTHSPAVCLLLVVTLYGRPLAQQRR